MTNATHDSAVHLLTDHQRFVRLVVQREIKGPLEMPQSPRSPLLKSAAVPPIIGNNRMESKSVNSENIIETHKSFFAKSSPVVTENSSNAHSVNVDDIPKTNGIHEKKIAQPIPAPRRLTSESSTTNGVVETTNNSSNGPKADDEEPQVSQFFFFSC